MWRTPKGTRIITGVEALLFRETIGMMIDELLTERECEDIEGMQTTYRVEAFDVLPLMQRLGLLHDVASALLRADVQLPKLTAVNEAALAAIINNVDQLIWFEIDNEDVSIDEVLGDRHYWRRLLLACNDAAEDGPVTDDEEFAKTVVSSSDKKYWDIEIQVLENRFLWDIDFEYTDIPDMPPEKAAAERRALNIERDYYTALAPDPREKEFDALIERVRALCNGAP